MALDAGFRLGPYEIVSPAGSGGMGEVYRARDTRLDRTVAIKILPTALAGDPGLRERFDREARAISALNHPHICTLYDVGHQAGTDYLVLEYLEGETLSDRLARMAGPAPTSVTAAAPKGPGLPASEALGIAIQIAGALDTAHRAGIVHRDLKPANVMLTKAGAKLLDFGLAKTAAPVIATSGLSMPSGENAASLSAPGPCTNGNGFRSPKSGRIQVDRAFVRRWDYAADLCEAVPDRRPSSGVEKRRHGAEVGGGMEKSCSSWPRTAPSWPRRSTRRTDFSRGFHSHSL